MKKIPLLLALLLALTFSSAALGADLPLWNGQHYLSGRLIVGFAAETASPEAVLAATGATSYYQIYPYLQDSPLASARELARIWEFFLPADADVPSLCAELASQPEIVWAEPRWALESYQIRAADDPLRPVQYHLSNMNCETAWWWASGASPSAIVGIIDSGVMYDHPDLAPNMYVNPGEDLDSNGMVDPTDWNGLDDDHNSYPDDFWGWDWVNIGQSNVWPGEDGEDPDNDPSDFDGHGTHCAGDASEGSNNALGGAGVGWGVRIMALRTGYMAASGQGYNSYYNEGIVYAANNGADVISMSFGGPGYSSYTQSVLNMAFDQGVVAVAAAGNESSSAYSYPAAYTHVIAVGATDQADYMADFSNFGGWVDVFAPGVDIRSTTNNGGYGNMSGTSMACPVTAGAAALVKSLYPDLNGDEVAARLIATCDTVDTNNPLWPQALRVNAGNACDWVCGVMIYQIQDADSSGRLSAGESADFVIYVRNYAPQDLTALYAELSCDDPEVTVSNNLCMFGDLTMYSIANNTGLPFGLELVPTFTGFRTAELRLHFADATGFDYIQTIEVPLGRGDVLVVNGDQEQSSEVYYYYTSALDNLDKTWEVWDVARQALPTAADLAPYPTVIWYTGTAVADVLPEYATWDLATYLDGGGHLLLSGQNIARELADRSDPFLNEYLGCSYVDDDAADYSILGVEGDPISSGMSFIILGAGGAENQDSPDVIEANASGQPLAIYSDSQPQRQAGVHSLAHGAAVFLSFGFEAINDSVPAYTNRTTFMNAILTWFDQNGIAENNAGPLPQTYALGQNFPNPFNAETIIPLELPVRSQITIELFNVRGQNLGTIYEGVQNAGWPKVRFQAAGSASGVYIYRITAQGLENGGRYQNSGKMLVLK